MLFFFFKDNGNWWAGYKKEVTIDKKIKIWFCVDTVHCLGILHLWPVQLFFKNSSECEIVLELLLTQEFCQENVYFDRLPDMA